MENARRVVAKITEFPWGQFCLCYCCRNCVSGSNKMWLETFQANFHDETKNISSFFLFRKQFYHFLGVLRRIIGDHFWDLLLPHYSVAFVTLCEKAISQQIWRVVPTTDVAARFLIRLKVVQKRKENGFYWWWCSESSFTYPAALLRSSLSSLFWFSGFLRPQNWTLEIWTVLRLMCNEVVSKVKGGGSQGDLTGLQSQGNPQPMHLPRLQRDQPHWRQYTLDSQKTISKLWTLRHLSASASWTSARIQEYVFP